MKKFVASVALATAAASVAGTSLSACGSAPQEPVIKTVTKTIPAKPIVKTRTVTKVEYRTPKSCLDALSAAEQVSHLASRFARVSSQYPMMVRDAFKAGLDGDPYAAQNVLNRMKHSTSQFDSINAQLNPV